MKPKTNEYYIARIKYWGEDEPIVDVVLIFYVWRTGEIDFLPCASGYGGDPIRNNQCESFELLERVEVEKYL